jgi:hypothetical protein
MANEWFGNDIPNSYKVYSALGDRFTKWARYKIEPTKWTAFTTTSSFLQRFMGYFSTPSPMEEEWTSNTTNATTVS